MGEMVGYVADLIAAVGRDCPACGASAGDPCVSLGHDAGRPMSTVHRERLGQPPGEDMVAAMAVACPACGAARGAPCVGLRGAREGRPVQEPHGARRSVLLATFRGDVRSDWDRVDRSGRRFHDPFEGLWDVIEAEQALRAAELAPVWAGRERDRRERAESLASARRAADVVGEFLAGHVRGRGPQVGSPLNAGEASLLQRALRDFEYEYVRTDLERRVFAQLLLWLAVHSPGCLGDGDR